VVLRQVFAVLVLPFTVAVLIPAWIVRAGAVAPAMPATALGWGSLLIGLPVLVAGGALFATSVGRFGGEGEGTLAPWDPPVRLVVRGPYAYVRNPMISGVVLLLLSEGLLLRSAPHMSWAGLFFLINAVYIPLAEEPGLRVRFGGDYEEYAENVPRLVPRITPWNSASGKDT